MSMWIQNPFGILRRPTSTLLNTITTVAGVVGLTIAVATANQTAFQIKDYNGTVRMYGTGSGNLVMSGVLVLHASSYNCNTLGNSGKLTTTSTGAVVCASDIGTQGGVVSGTGTTNLLSYWTAAHTLSGTSLLQWDQTNKRVGVNIVSPKTTLEVNGAFSGASLSIGGRLNKGKLSVTGSGTFTGSLSGATIFSQSGAQMLGGTMVLTAGNVQQLRIRDGTTTTQFTNISVDNSGHMNWNIHGGLASSLDVFQIDTTAVGGVGAYNLVNFKSQGTSLFSVNSAGDISVVGTLKADALTGKTNTTTVFTSGQGYSANGTAFTMNTPASYGSASTAKILDVQTSGTAVFDVFEDGRVLHTLKLATASGVVIKEAASATASPFIVTNSSNAIQSQMFASGALSIRTAVYRAPLNVLGGMSGSTLTISATPTEGSSQNALCITAQGAVQENSTTTCLVSSLRFKHEIQTLQDIGLQEVNLLRPVTYLDNGSNDPNIGLIAEEVAKVQPRCVFYDKDGKTVRGVKYENCITSLLVKAVQELDRRTRGVKISNPAITSADIAALTQQPSLDHSWIWLAILQVAIVSSVILYVEYRFYSHSH